jgi:AraC family transcriptional regulator
VELTHVLIIQPRLAGGFQILRNSFRISEKLIRMQGMLNRLVRQNAGSSVAAAKSMPTAAPDAPESLAEIIGSARWPSAAFFSAKQNIHMGALWEIRRNMDTVIVHLSGKISEIETELDGVNEIFDPPMPGEVWVIPAGQQYRSRARGKRVHYAELHFDRMALEALAGNPAAEVNLRPRAGHFDDFLCRATLQLEQLSARQDDLAVMAAQTLSHSLLFHFYANYGGDRRTKRSLRMTSKEKRLIQEYISDNLDSQLSLESVGAEVGMTTHEFLQAFGSAFATTPAQYVIDQRLRRARWLLLNTGKNITTIAQDVGFSSHAHLCTAFRSRLKITPSQFRQIGRAAHEPK